MRKDPRKDMIVNELEDINASWILDRIEFKKYEKAWDRMRGLGLLIKKGKITNWEQIKEKTYTESDMIRAWDGWFKWKWWKFNQWIGGYSSWRLYVSSYTYTIVKRYRKFYCLVLE